MMVRATEHNQTLVHALATRKVGMFSYCNLIVDAQGFTPGSSRCSFITITTGKPQTCNYCCVSVQIQHFYLYCILNTCSCMDATEPSKSVLDLRVLNICDERTMMVRATEHNQTLVHSLATCISQSWKRFSAC